MQVMVTVTEKNRLFDNPKISDAYFISQLSFVRDVYNSLKRAWESRGREPLSDFMHTFHARRVLLQPHSPFEVEKAIYFLDDKVDQIAIAKSECISISNGTAGQRVYDLVSNVDFDLVDNPWYQIGPSDQIVYDEEQLKKLNSGRSATRGLHLDLSEGRRPHQGGRNEGVTGTKGRDRYRK